MIPEERDDDGLPSAQDIRMLAAAALPRILGEQRGHAGDGKRKLGAGGKIVTHERGRIVYGVFESYAAHGDGGESEFQSRLREIIRFIVGMHDR